MRSIILAISQLSLGFLKQGILGLITGQLLSQIFANGILLNTIIKNKTLISKINSKKIVKLAKRYKKFPMFSAPVILANFLSRHLTNILISLFYGTATLGFYSLVQRVLGMPSTIIGASIGQVFFQHATIEKEKTGKVDKSFNIAIKKLTLIGFAFFGIIFFIVEDLFAFVFGEEWKIAGKYAEIIIPLFFIRFISSSISPILTIYEKQKTELVINIILISTSSTLILLFNNLEYLLSFANKINFDISFFYNLEQFLPFKDKVENFLYLFMTFMSINYLLLQIIDE